MKKALITIFILISVITILTACQKQAGSPEKPLASDQERIIKRTTRASLIVPVLTQDSAGEKSEYRLESQTARYLKDDKSQIEILLANNVATTCEQKADKLIDSQKIIKITISSNSGSIKAGDQKSNSKVVLQSAGGEAEITNLEKLDITTINDSIVRGQLKLGTKDLSFEGEYFAAICK